MSKKILIDAKYSEETRVAVVDNGRLLDFDFESARKKPLKGNIYLAKIMRIEPSLQAAFVEYGGNRHGFLPFNEIHTDYFRIPVDERPEVDSDEAEEGETTSSGDETAETDNPYKKYRIQEVVHSRQIILVQVVKEERGNKGAALTTFVSLAGRYCVLMPNAGYASGGVSRKITDMNDRKRLKKLVQDLEIPETMSLIVRTAGLDRNKTEIRRDYKYLTRVWTSIREDTLSAIAPSLIYEEADLIRRTVRDVYSKDVDEILVEGENAYRVAKDFIKMLMPSRAKKVQKYADPQMPIFYKYDVENQLDNIHNSHVRLSSGGSLVINQTEALVAIDVNSGRSTKERHIEETAFKTNLEAAEEVARQVRLRDLAGLIVVDFIDMPDNRSNVQVEKKLKESLALDRARIQVGRISQFGLLEMSRQRLRPSLMEASTLPCVYCEGTGVVRSPESLGLTAIRFIEDAHIQNKGLKFLRVYMSAAVVFYLINEKKSQIIELENRFSSCIKLMQDEQVGGNGIRLEKENGEPLDLEVSRQTEEVQQQKAKRSRRSGPSKNKRSEVSDTPPRKSRRRRRPTKSEDKEDSSRVVNISDRKQNLEIPEAGLETGESGPTRRVWWKKLLES